MKKFMTMLALTIMLSGRQLIRQNNPAIDPTSLPQAEENLKTDSPERKQVMEFREKNKVVAPGGIVFVGDSITAGFPLEKVLPSYHIANRGIGGDSIWAMIKRLDASAYELRPRKIFLMIGINDIFCNQMTVPDYAKLFDYIFTELQKNCPGCKIYVQSILPVRGRIANIDAADLNRTVREVNLEIQALSRKHRLTYIDLHPMFADEKGEMKTEYSNDGVHPNQAGYEAWAQKISKSLK